MRMTYYRLQKQIFESTCFGLEMRFHVTCLEKKEKLGMGDNEGVTKFEISGLRRECCDKNRRVIVIQW